MIRTHPAGSLRAEHAGQTVTLAGWVARRRDHGGVAFVDLRDASGLVQVVIRDEAVAAGLRSEFCIVVTGDVAVRPAGNANPALPTGDVEVVASSVEVLSEAAPLPFQIDDHVEVGEEVRLKYRYLDLRRSGPAAALRLRSEVNRAAREVLHERDFVEVETPTLTRSTPEGARDFLVPVRLQPGHWYALPQSPQLFKQLLMVAGFERYFQIARCYRDEDFRADRQPEFTQLDIEMSFVDQADVLEVGEEIVAALWRLVGFELPRPLPVMTYAESMARFGNDKPDMRFGYELVDMTEYFAETPFRVFQAPYVGAVVMPGGAAQSRRELDAWQDWAKARGSRGLAYALVGPDGELGGPIARNLSEQERSGLAKAVDAAPGDAIFFAAGEPDEARPLLGAARLEIGRRCGLIDESAWSFLWVVDAPMFERSATGGWTAVHHPFTSPNSEWADRFQDEPDKALAYAYDIVCNGNEIGGGSIRIHRAEMQQRVFDVIGLSRGEAQEKFGFLLDAFAFGPPPHGGIAFGWDRVCMLLSGVDSLREVIAFPKTGAGYDPLTGAPTPITPEQRKEAGIDVTPRDADRAVPPNAPGHGVLPDDQRN
ncbi:MAG: aspartyl-tRNA synthetase [Actinomycetota bacterium]|nr:aspartyl-tRNA synthetase [Actinomycetota bacterium]